MRGDWAIGETDPRAGAERGRREGSTLGVHLAITIDDLDVFLDDPKRVAVAKGYVECPALGGRLRIGDGVFNLLIRSGPAARQMRYTLPFSGPAGEPYLFVGDQGGRRRCRVRCLGGYDHAVHHHLPRGFGGWLDRRQRRPAPEHPRPRAPDDDVQDPAQPRARDTPARAARLRAVLRRRVVGHLHPPAVIFEAAPARRGAARTGQRNGAGSRRSYGARKKQ